MASRGTDNIEAYDCFLRGRERSWQHTRTGNIAARHLLGHAIAIDPHYAAAHALVAVTHVVDYVNGWAADPEQSLQTAFEVGQGATAMDDEEPQAHFAAALACLWRRELDQALDRGRPLPRPQAQTRPRG